MPFNPNDELTMRLTVNEWNQVIAVLNDGQYKIVAPLINKINVQAAQQERQAATLPPGFTNGEDQEAQTQRATPAITPRGDLN